MMGDSLGSTGSGSFEAPESAAKALESMEELFSQSKPFNSVKLMDELYGTLWWGTESGSQEVEDRAQQRLSGLGWALQELAHWTPQPPFALYRLQVVLTTLLVSSQSDREAVKAVPQEMAHLPALNGLTSLLRATTSVAIPSHRNGLAEHKLTEEALAAGRSGNYKKLGNHIHHLEMELPPDVHLAVMLLARLAPDRLACQIEERQDVFFSVAVRVVLAEDALRFSLLVNDVTFKFVCASPLGNLRIEHAPEGSVEVVCELLLQVSQTDFWHAWLLDFARYPHGGTVAEKALSKALPQLTPIHWSAYVDAVELWTGAGTAEPVAYILVTFFHALGDEKSAEMWRLAFERWNSWDYDCDLKDKQLSAPCTCSFDFPVAMYYALLPLDEVHAEETRLLEGIATVEQKWFTDLSELVTYRNRLSSRLRLVQHGLAIRNPPTGGANPLPPRIEPESEFSEFRYRFFDVSAPRRRGR